MNESLKQVGWNLVEDAQRNEEFSYHRGLINELFPYIYEASKRMSCRAISRWLDANGNKLSAATIAKALRNPKSHWQELADEIEPAARIFANAHGVSITQLLADDELFHHLKDATPVFTSRNNEPPVALSDYQSAATTLNDDWFSLPEGVLEACLASADFDGEADSQEGAENAGV